MSRALALKYRPKRFSDLIGQESISQTIKLSLRNNKLSHAYLFSGLRGSGKTSTARIFAKALVCDKTPAEEPCGQCDGCVSAEEGRHLDIVEMDAASNRGIDDIRQLIESTKYKPSIAKYKIYIIDEVHMLSTPAFNALLKTLEEPPEYVKFILATTDPIKLPPTILSRTIHFRFKKIGFSDVVEHLKHILGREKVAFEEQALEILARNGNGSLRDTLTLLDQAIVFSNNFVSNESVVELLGAVNPDKIQSLMGFILKRDKESTLACVKEFACHESENVINEIIEFLKLNIIQKNKNIPLYVFERFFRIAIDSKELLFMGADGDFVLMLTFLKMLEAIEIEDIDSLISKYESGVDFAAQKTVKYDLPTIIETSTIIKEIKPIETICDDRWSKLLGALFERSYDVGRVFEESVRFVSFEDEKLIWASFAGNDEKELLRKYYAQIKHIVQDVYGVNTTICAQKDYVDAGKTADLETQSSAKPIRQNQEEIESETVSTDFQIELIKCDTKPQEEAIDSESGAQKSIEDEAVELSLLRHPLVEKSKEVFGLTDMNISIFQKV